MPLNVNYIGGLGSLTSQEEKTLSEYFKNKKLKLNAKKSANKNTVA